MVLEIIRLNWTGNNDIVSDNEGPQPSFTIICSGNRTFLQLFKRTLCRVYTVLQEDGTVKPRYNAVVRRHLLGSRYKRGAL